MDSELIVKGLIDAGVSGLDGRLYPLVLPEGVTLPAATYQILREFPEVAHDGPEGLTNPTIQVSVFGETYEDAKTLANEIKVLLNGYSALDKGALFVDLGPSFVEPNTRLYSAILEISGWTKE